MRDKADHGARRALLIIALVAAVALLVAALAPRVITWSIARGRVATEVTDLNKLPRSQQRAAIVLGAGVVNDRPSPLLADRIDAAVKLLNAGRVDLLLMSGDNSTQYYDEPTVMRRRAIDRGAPSKVVAADYAGRRTWDSCVRAKRVFGIDEAVVVTSAFHVDRAIAACRAAGIDVTGFSVPDKRFTTSLRSQWRLREVAATSRALADAWITRPEPAVGGAPIDPYDPCELKRSLAPSDAADDAALEDLECDE
jgi:vancomycin permeability regulator SanA